MIEACRKMLVRNMSNFCRSVLAVEIKQVCEEMRKSDASVRLDNGNYWLSRGRCVVSAILGPVVGSLGSEWIGSALSNRTRVEGGGIRGETHGTLRVLHWSRRVCLHRRVTLRLPWTSRHEPVRS